MGYLANYSCVPIHESFDLAEFVKKRALESASRPKLRGVKGLQQDQTQNPESNSGWIKQNPETKAEAVKTMEPPLFTFFLRNKARVSRMGAFRFIF